MTSLLEQFQRLYLKEGNKFLDSISLLKREISEIRELENLVLALFLKRDTAPLDYNLAEFWFITPEKQVLVKKIKEVALELGDYTPADIKMRLPDLPDEILELTPLNEEEAFKRIEAYSRYEGIIKGVYEAFASLYFENSQAITFLLSDLFNKRDLKKGFDEVKQIIEGEKVSAILPIPFGGLNSFLSGGLRKPSYTIIGARPGIGKTLIGVELANFFSEKGVKTLFVSAELPASQIALRLLARRTGIPYQAISDPYRLTNEEKERVMEELEKLKSNPYIDILDLTEKGAPSVTDIEATILKERDYPYEVVIIDYIQLIYPPDYYVGMPENTRVSRVSQYLRILRNREDLVIIALAQLNREKDKRGDKRPLLSDLKQSGSLEEDADVILLLYNQDDLPKRKKTEAVVFETDLYSADEINKAKEYLKEKIQFTPSPIGVRVAKNRYGKSWKDLVWFLVYPTQMVFDIENVLEELHLNEENEDGEGVDFEALDVDLDLDF